MARAVVRPRSAAGASNGMLARRPAALANPLPGGPAMQPNAPPKTGQTVRFVVSDLVHPPPAHVLAELFADLHLEGEVVAETDDGQMAYLVVRVAGLTNHVI